MTNRLELNWELDGLVEEQRYYCSETPLDVNNLPLPKAVLAGDVRNYVDYVGDFGKKYYIRIGAVKDTVEKISEETEIVFGSIWNPENLTNQAKLWLSSDSIVADSSDRISQVNDLSGNAYHATRSINSNKPTFSNESISFDGINDYMTVNSGLDLFRNINKSWIFAVVSKNTRDTSDIERPIIVFSTNTDSYRVGLTVGNTVAGNKNKICFGGRRLDAEVYNGVNSSFEITPNQDYIVCGVIDYDNRKIELYVDGYSVASKTNAFTSSGNTSNTASSRIRVGSNAVLSPTAFGDIDISTTMAGNTQLSTEDRQKLEGWAAHKYGLTANLPADHPYKTSAPTI